MENNQTKNLFKNSFITGVIFVIQMIMSFVTRTLFIKFLGVEILGFNGVISNILMVLSVAELGIGPALIFSLYKPLAENEVELVKILMKFYKKIYTLIGLIIAGLGLVLIPFLPFIVDSSAQIDHLYLYYLLFLSNTVVSYFFTYKRSIIIADQKNYIVASNDFLYWMMFQISSCFAIMLYSSFTAYLIFQLLSTIAANLSISFIADKKFPYLKDKPSDTQLPQNLKSEIKKNTIGQFTNKIGTMVVNGTDNILISIFIGLSQVGMYVNYTLIVTSVTNLINQIINSMTATIGNVGITGSRSDSVRMFENHLFFVHSIGYFCSFYLIVLFNPFIILWLGSKFTFSFFTVILIVLNFSITISRKSALSFIDAYGLAWYQKYKPVFESIVNLGLSILFITVFHLGVDGVLLGTIISSITISCWFEPYVLYKHGFSEPFKKFAILAVKNYGTTVIGLIMAIVTALLTSELRGFQGFILQILITSTILISSFIAINIKRREFRWFLHLVLRKKHN